MFEKRQKPNDWKKTWQWHRNDKKRNKEANKTTSSNKQTRQKMRNKMIDKSEMTKDMTKQKTKNDKINDSTISRVWLPVFLLLCEWRALANHLDEWHPRSVPRLRTHEWNSGACLWIIPSSSASVLSKAVDQSAHKMPRAYLRPALEFASDHWDTRAGYSSLCCAQKHAIIVNQLIRWVVVSKARLIYDDTTRRIKRVQRIPLLDPLAHCSRAVGEIEGKWVCSSKKLRWKTYACYHRSKATEHTKPSIHPKTLSLRGVWHERLGWSKQPVLPASQVWLPEGRPGKKYWQLDTQELEINLKSKLRSREQNSGFKQRELHIGQLNTKPLW